MHDFEDPKEYVPLTHSILEIAKPSGQAYPGGQGSQNLYLMRKFWSIFYAYLAVEKWPSAHDNYIPPLGQ
jgi:hypothetical protein